jgi:hypothetical protein
VPSLKASQFRAGISERVEGLASRTEKGTPEYDNLGLHIRRIAKNRGTYGYRRISAALSRKAPIRVNHTRRDLPFRREERVRPRSSGIIARPTAARQPHANPRASTGSPTAASRTSRTTGVDSDHK